MATKNQSVSTAAVKGTEHGYLVGAYTKLTIGKAAGLLGRSALASGQYLTAFSKNTVKGFTKTA